MKKPLELIGQRYGRLVVVERKGSNKQGNSMWLCKCDCGQETIVNSQRLKSAKTKSCGCYRSVPIVKLNTTHGKTNTRLYTIWQRMKSRCMNQNDISYHNYGGRGINVCDEWRNNFKAFYDYVSELEHFGEIGYTLDRINNDRNYEPDNIRWATWEMQASNRRNSIRKSTA